MPEEKKKFTGSNRPVRKQSVPERKELPASQRRHAAQLSERAKEENTNRPVRRQTTNTNGPKRNSNNRNNAPKSNSANKATGADRTKSRPNNSLKPTSGKPMVREKKMWSTKPQAGQTDYSKKKDTSLQDYVKENNRRQEKQNTKKTASKPADTQQGKKDVKSALTIDPAAIAAAPIAPANNNQRNNKRKTNDQNQGPAAATPRRKDHAKGSKKQQRIAAKQKQQAAPVPQRKEQPLPEVLEYKVGMNVQDLSKLLHRDTAEIIKKLFMLGIVTNQNKSLDADTIEILAADYGIDAKEKVEEDVADIDKFFDDENLNEENMVSRPPVVTIMGHVDHGKTTLLDYLRKSNVTEGEAGGITQHIGAYQTKLNDRLITFLDTPGHAAFTEMRARGANVTDITVLVVAADDGVMPQTREAINHAKAAGTPIIVAVNKIDKPGAEPDRVMNQLMEYELIPEEYGGDTIFVKISAKLGQNVDELLEMILLTADVLELKADPTTPARGSVVEARLDKGKGSMATVLVQQGTMHVGDPIVVGNTYGRVRTMTNERGQDIKEAKPATPVLITGLNDVPEAGDRFVVMESEKQAREAGEERAQRALEKVRNSGQVVTLENLFNTMAEKQMKSVPLIVKADVQGSVEALVGSFKKIDVDGVKVDIIHTAVGAVNESDVTLAAASNAIIIGFNVRPTPMAKAQAEQDDVDVRLYNVIYNAIDDVEAAMKGQLEPVYKERIIGQVEVKELFKFSKIGTIIGGFVSEGSIKNDAKLRLIRDGVVIYEGEVGSLQRGKDQAKEVKSGLEMGMTIKNYNDAKVGDVIEAYVMEEVPVV